MRALNLRASLSLALAGIAATPISAWAQQPAPAPQPMPPAATPPTPPAPPTTPPGTPAPTTTPAPVVVSPESPAEPPAAKPMPEPMPGMTASAPPAAAPAAAESPAAAAAPAPVAETPPIATVSGYVDAAYHANFSKYSAYAGVPLRSYDQFSGNTFLLHAAHVGISHSFGPEGSAFISLDLGSDATVNNFAYAAPNGGTPSAPGANTFSNVPVDVREGYGKWTPGDFMLRAGKFVTYNGIEVVDGPLNPTITRGYLFGLAEPVTNTGVDANYTIGGGVAHIGVGLSNGWDDLVDNNNQKTIEYHADVIPSTDFHAQLSGYWGAEQPNNDKNHRFTADLTGAGVLGPLTLNFQGNVGTESFPNAPRNTWWGIGVQPLYVMDAFSLGARVEYFNDKTGTRVALPGAEKESLLNFTITPGYMPTKGFMIRAEYRIDAVLSAKDPTGADFTKILNGKSTQSTIAIGGTYSF